MKKVLKYLLYIVAGLLALIGILAVGLWCFFHGNNHPYDGPEDHLAEHVELLQQSSFKADSVQYQFVAVRDLDRAREIMDYFKLDTLYSPNATTWEKAVAISKFVATNIPHDEPDSVPDHSNAIDLWKYTKEVNPGFNCRMHAILNYELMQAAGLTARYVTCLPQDENDPDCHVVNEVWLPELGKWAFIDSDMDGHYCTDEEGTPLSLLEMREKYAADEQMVMYPRFENPTSEQDYYYAYMAKNTYWFSCWETLHFYQEDDLDTKIQNLEPQRNIIIIPEGFAPSAYSDQKCVVTNDASRFWMAPKQ